MTELPLIAPLIHLFSGTVYSRGLKCLQVIYASFDCDLTQAKPSTITSHAVTRKATLKVV